MAVEPPAKRATWARALGASVRDRERRRAARALGRAKAHARRAFDRYDVRSVLDALDAAELRAATDAKVRAHAARARKWVEQNFDDAESLAALAWKEARTLARSIGGSIV